MNGGRRRVLRSQVPRIRLTEFQLDRIEPLAAEQGITVSMWVRAAVQKELEAQER